MLPAPRSVDFGEMLEFRIQAETAKIAPTSPSVVSRSDAKRMFAASELPSASLAIRDILFTPLDTGRNPAERQPLGSFIRTTRTGSEAHFGPFSCLSSAPFSDATEPRPFWYGYWNLVRSTG